MEENLIEKNYDNVPFKLKWKDINFFNRWGLVISSILTVITLIISWFFWLTIYRNNIDELLNTISNQGFIFNFHFWQLTIWLFIFALFFLAVTIISFLFLNKNNLVSLIIVIITIFMAIILIIGWIIFAVYANKGFQVYIKRNSSKSILFFIFPWIINIIFLASILIFCILLMIEIIQKPEKLNVASPEFEPNIKAKSNNVINDKIVPTSLAPSNPKKPVRNKKDSEEVNFSALEYNRLKHTLVGTPPVINLLEDLQWEVPINNDIYPYQEDGPFGASSQEYSENDAFSAINDSTVGINDEPNDDLTPSYTTVINKPTPKPALTAIKSEPIKPILTEVSITKKTLVPSKVWTLEQINKTWEKGFVAQTKKYKYDASTYRQDYAGALMFKNAFIANPDVEDSTNPRTYNWTIVYQRPLACGGTKDLSNLWPLNCMNANTKGENYPRWKTTVSFNGKENYIKVKKWKGKRRICKIKK